MTSARPWLNRRIRTALYRPGTKKDANTDRISIQWELGRPWKVANKNETENKNETWFIHDHPLSNRQTATQPRRCRWILLHRAVSVETKVILSPGPVPILSFPFRFFFSLFSLVNPPDPCSTCVESSITVSFALRRYFSSYSHQLAADIFSLINLQPYQRGRCGCGCCTCPMCMSDIFVLYVCTLYVGMYVSHPTVRSMPTNPLSFLRVGNRDDRGDGNDRDTKSFNLQSLIGNGPILLW